MRCWQSSPHGVASWHWNKSQLKISCQQTTARQSHQSHAQCHWCARERTITQEWGTKLQEGNGGRDEFLWVLPRSFQDGIFYAWWNQLTWVWTTSTVESKDNVKFSLQPCPFFTINFTYCTLEAVTYCPEFSAMLWSWLSGSPASIWSPEANCGSRQSPGWPLGLLSLQWGLGGGGGGGRSGSESSLDISLCLFC